jgi:asparagine synthase (glutamine-hydrolysing)
VLLSGGLDSSLLVGLLADHVKDLRTFSIGFEDLGGGAEKADVFEYSDQVVAHFKTRHHKFSIPNSEVMARLPEAVAQMTEPMVSHDVIAFYLLGESGNVGPGCRRGVWRLFLVPKNGRQYRHTTGAFCPALF